MIDVCERVAKAIYKVDHPAFGDQTWDMTTDEVRAWYLKYASAALQETRAVDRENSFLME